MPRKERARGRYSDRNHVGIRVRASSMKTGEMNRTSLESWEPGNSLCLGVCAVFKLNYVMGKVADIACAAPQPLIKTKLSARCRRTLRPFKKSVKRLLRRFSRAVLAISD